MSWLRSSFKRGQRWVEGRLIELAVGRIATEWSRLEYATNQLFLEMLAMPDSTRARIVGNEMGHRDKLAAIKALSVRGLPHKEASYIVKLAYFIDNDLRVIRNEYVHGIFKGEPDMRALYHRTRITKPTSFALKVDVENEMVGIIENVFYPRAAIRECFIAVMFVAMHVQPDEPELSEIDTWLSMSRQCFERAKKLMAEYRTLATSSGDE